MPGATGLHPWLGPCWPAVGDAAVPAAALARFDDRTALPLVLSALLSIVLMPGDEANSWLVTLIVAVSWLVLLVDFVAHHRKIEHHLGYVGSLRPDGPRLAAAHGERRR